MKRDRTQDIKGTTLNELAQGMRDLFTDTNTTGNANDNASGLKFIMLFGHNGTGKTRLSMEFRNIGKESNEADTLYYNAFTEDLFHWNNDFEAETDTSAVRYLNFKTESLFFDAFKKLNKNHLIAKIKTNFKRYCAINVDINYNEKKITFSKNSNANIKISRGEERIFIWCVFIAVFALAINNDDKNAYEWVKYIYIDDPISSLDDNNAVSVALDLAQLLQRQNNRNIKYIISTHHSLFYNVMFNRLRNESTKESYILEYLKKDNVYLLKNIEKNEFLHHIAVLRELKKIKVSREVYPHHFNMLRSVIEKTATFLGFNCFSLCLTHKKNKDFHRKLLSIYSHGALTPFETSLVDDATIDSFIEIYDTFVEQYNFNKEMWD